MKDSAGMTPLAWACENGHDAIVEMVLRRFPNLAEVAPIELEEEELEQSPEMMRPKNRENMAKSGYRLVGSHSAVKQCRWTRNAILGQGQCYKHTFYGINSHQCMEATPSVACANKCTFCWRNHENPVATSWDFKMDDPDWIVQESIRTLAAGVRSCGQCRRKPKPSENTVFSVRRPFETAALRQCFWSHSP